ncbi:MAG TPA: ACP S-malonyltransferase [Coleofasciculaceae cyanobacterium]|jgi:[acyl-carrier-protein] S-malonyltransferase
MSRIAFVFPGQGSQSVGMGKDFYEAPAARRIYDVFNGLVAPNLSEVCFNGPDEELRRTLYTQPAILATSIAALELFQEQCQIQPALAAGHSLGEYGALYAAGVISLETAAQLVKRRSELMEAAPSGAMAAVLGLDGQTVETLVDTYRKEYNRTLTVANYNMDNQVVISGDPVAVDEIAATLKAAGAKRVMPLPVGGAFHSPLMNVAAEEFTVFLQGFEFNAPRFPVVTNVDALLTSDASGMRGKLGRQIDSSVRWTQTMDRMIRQERIDTVIEFGPGKVLTGMFKKMFPDVRLYNVFDGASLETTVAELKQAVVV